MVRCMKTAGKFTCCEETNHWAGRIGNLSSAAGHGYFILNHDLYPAVFDNDVVVIDRAFFGGKTGAVGHIESPAVKVAFDDLSIQPRIGERVTLVRAKILDGVEFTADVEKRKLRPVLQLNGGPAAGRDGLDLSYGYRAPGAFWLIPVLVLTHL